MILNRKAITKVQGILVIAVIIVAFVGVYYAILPSAPPPTTTTTATVAKPSKIFVAAEQYDFVTDIDPAYSFSAEIIAMANVYEGLLYFTGGNPEVRPSLATSYDVSQDGLTWTFKLREGVKFHDGTAFNATAVKYSYDRIRELGVGAVYIWDPVKELKILDTYTVQYTLSYAAPLQRIISSVYGAWIYSPKTAEIKDLHEWFNAGHDAGTGPYMLESVERGVQVTLTYFEDYWGGWGGPNAADRIAKVILKIVEDGPVRVQMIETGSAQYAQAVPTEERKRLETMKDIKVSWSTTYQNHIAFLNMKSPYLKDKLVRQAVSYAFPYQDFVAWGEGTLSQPRGPIPSGMWGHDDTLFQYNLNLAKAKELLTQAGYPNGGFKLSYYYISGVPTTRTAGELWKVSLDKLGVELDVRGMTWPSLWELIKQGPDKYNYDIVAFSWWPTYITPYDFLFSMWHTEQKPLWNAAFYSNPEYDRLIDEAFKLEGPQPQEAFKLYSQAQQILMEDSPSVYLDDVRLPFVTRSNVMGFTFNPALGSDTMLFYEIWLST